MRRHGNVSPSRISCTERCCPLRTMCCLPMPQAAKPIAWVLPLLARLLRLILGRSFCFPLYIPTPLGRALTFKLLLSASRIPGLGELMRLGFKVGLKMGRCLSGARSLQPGAGLANSITSRVTSTQVLSFLTPTSRWVLQAMLDGDVSQWDRALQMPHYNAEDMPAISLDQGEAEAEARGGREGREMNACGGLGLPVVAVPARADTAPYDRLHPLPNVASGRVSDTEGSSHYFTPCRSAAPGPARVQRLLQAVRLRQRHRQPVALRRQPAAGRERRVLAAGHARAPGGGPAGRHHPARQHPPAPGRYEGAGEHATPSTCRANRRQARTRFWAWASNWC